MYRILCRTLLILIRLAIVLSLAGYSLSTATAAMHAPSSEASAQMPHVMQHGEGAQMSAHDHRKTASADDGASKSAQQECCKGFCIGLAIIASSTHLDAPVLSPIREFTDDHPWFGEIHSLYRPPSL
jgi:hypothetical protein